MPAVIFPEATDDDALFLVELFMNRLFKRKQMRKVLLASCLLYRSNRLA
jgi:hypothetical protein